jgi:cytochrome b6-f complex iron-sulfur subunit
VVVRLSESAALAASATCTHAFCTMAWDGARVHCPCHNANFATDGAVLSGPTSIPIPVYAATVAADAIIVQIDG